ncbi:unnamed protein product [Caenorhabditis angaria]|uniref:carbamoyl-phosphate synthase (ammonia) n=1 Tax=Caenorhabditis angaria TaxID=860376 RepID=A0A9P1IQD3_9PELO|nr:unnamed protein product [Caenorhabditis angaria]
MSLSRAQMKIFGTSPNDIDNAEDRFKFSRKLELLKISQPQWKKSENMEDAKSFCAQVGYPCLIRPSYVLSGAAMNVAHNAEDLEVFLKQAAVVAKDHPVSLFSTVFVVPKKNIFISIGGYHAKAEMLKSVEILQHLGYELYGSKGTADYFKMNKINVKPVDWPFEEGSSDEKMASGSRSVVEFLENKEFHLVINLPIRGSGAYRVSAFRTRRMAVDNGIPLITDIKCVHLVKIPFSFQTIFRYLSIHLINVV